MRIIIPIIIFGLLTGLSCKKKETYWEKNNKDCIITITNKGTFDKKNPTRYEMDLITLYDMLEERQPRLFEIDGHPTHGQLNFLFTCKVNDSIVNQEVLKHSNIPKSKGFRYNTKLNISMGKITNDAEGGKQFNLKFTEFWENGRAFKKTSFPMNPLTSHRVGTERSRQVCLKYNEEKSLYSEYFYYGSEAEGNRESWEFILSAVLSDKD